jgi:hypothetical protein
VEALDASARDAVAPESMLVLVPAAQPLSPMATMAAAATTGSARRA